MKFLKEVTQFEKINFNLNHGGNVYEAKSTIFAHLQNDPFF